MIRVTIELEKFSDGSTKHLREIRISNVGESGLKTDTHSEYSVEMFGVNGQFLRGARVENWPRLSWSVEELVAEAINQLRK